MGFLDRTIRWFRSIVHHDDYAVVEVERGDTLWAIVMDVTQATSNAEIQRHIDEVVKLNPGLDPDKIYVGQELRVPLSWVTSD